MVPDLLRHIRITDYTYRSVLGHRYSKVPLVLESTCVVLRLFMAILPSLGFIELTNECMVLHIEPCLEVLFLMQYRYRLKKYLVSALVQKLASYKSAFLYGDGPKKNS